MGSNITGGQLVSLTFHSYPKADTKVDTRGLSSGEQMFRYNRGQTRVGTAVIVGINDLFNNDNSRCLKESITFTSPQ
ncbi:hypothetical protein J1N35_022215 [Gossypium stocksii]|uniref:Uncharacterized protein n=1 Tax=Gossypium stocksii TaxID=47602 RepID=A0A9D3VHA9_9ROSI|nr:hypothetical protein J1N35_022215 [Gossypium stocksii]